MDFELLKKGLMVSGYGLAGVFSVLILFFIVVKILTAISNKMSEKEAKNTQE